MTGESSMKKFCIEGEEDGERETNEGLVGIPTIMDESI